jgi:hypothetical protein
MRNATIVLALLLTFAVGAPPVQANTLFYYGHGGINEGHTQLAALYASVGCGGTFAENNNPTLPGLGSFNLVFISVPGYSDPTAFFSAAEKAQLQTWLQSGQHRLVLIGEWNGFYGAGAAVMIDLINSIGVGGMAFLPGVYDSGCNAYACAAGLSADPLVAGLTHLCKAATSTWNEGGGSAVAFPVEAPADPLVISNGTYVPCIIGIGDSNVLSDGCNYIANDADTREFALRICRLNCEGVVSSEAFTWGRVKGAYR